MTHVLIRKFGHRKQRRQSCENGGRDKNDVSTSKEHQGLLATTRSSEWPGTDSPSQLPEGTNPANNWILYF
jgi:hypothetical protein